MESSSKTQWQVGLFLVFGLAVAMISIFMIGGDSMFFGGNSRLHARFAEVQGLAEGSVVSLSGINVGNIEKIEFLPEANEIDVTLKIGDKFMPRFTADAKVEIRTQGALGDKYLFVIPGDPKKPALKDGDRVEVAQASDLFGIFAERGKETEKIFDIINELYKTTRTVNADGRLEKIMANMASASAALKDASAGAQRFSAGLADTNTGKIKQSLDRVDSILSKIDRGEGTLGALINDPTLHERLKAIVGGSSRPLHVKSMLRTSIEKAESK